MSRTPEGTLKQTIRRTLSERGAFWSNIQNGAYAKPGDPDIVVCYRGRYLGIEAKAPNGRQSDIQRARQRQLERAGGVYVLARSVGDVAAALDAIDEEVEEMMCAKEGGE